MPDKPTAPYPIESLRCELCGRGAKIDVPSQFACSNCGQVNQIGILTERLKGPIVWLAGDPKPSD